MPEQGVPESRSPYDTPLSELDCEVFTEFYFDFLGKTADEKLEFLKGLTLMRQGQRRAFIHSVMAGRGLAETIFITPAERALLLTFPSTLQNIWNSLIEYKRDYRGMGSAPLTPVRDMAVNYLATIEQIRDQLNEKLKSARPIQPKEKLNLAVAFASTGELKQTQRATYQVLLIVLTSKPFLCILPENTIHSTAAIGKLRNYINQMLGGAELHIEFFTTGGAVLRRKGNIEISGSNAIFDVIFDNPSAPFSSKLIEQYYNAKFTLIYEILSEEFPTEAFAWESCDL